MSQKPIKQPWEPVEYTEAEAMAIKAFASGTANEGQQRLAYDWIVGVVCRVNDMSYFPGGLEAQRATDFAEGRRFAGSQIRKMLAIDVTSRSKEAA